MKFIYFIPLVFLLFACPSGGNQNATRLVKANKMDFPDLEKTEFDNVSFKLSKLFENGFYSPNLTIQDKNFERSILQMSIYFSVESFDQNYISSLKFLEGDSLSDLEVMHNYYIKKRASSLNDQLTSVRKTIPKGVGFKGYQQFVEGSSYSSSRTPNMYMIASVEIDNKIFVFQLIGPQKNMGYFYDDFLKILNSIEK